MSEFDNTNIGLSIYNRPISAAQQQKLNRMAVMNTLSENEYVEAYFKRHKPPATLNDIINEYNKNGAKSSVNACEMPTHTGSDPYMEILKDYVEKNEEVGSFQILDYTTEVEVGRKQVREDLGKYLTIQGVDDKDIYMAFNGTEKGEGVDNGQLLSKGTLTTQQQESVRYYERIVEKYGLEQKGSKVHLSGHSKGGNRVTATVMSTKYPELIDQALNLDGPGSSPEMINEWQKAPDYDERRQKITKISGDHDPVHCTGISIEGDIRYVKYEDGSDIGDIHFLKGLFQSQVDAEGKRHYTSQLQPESQACNYVKAEIEFMEYFMALPRSVREQAATFLMELIWSNQSPDGVSPDRLKGILSTLQSILYPPEAFARFTVFLTLFLTEWIDLPAIARLVKILNEYVEENWAYLSGAFALLYAAGGAIITYTALFTVGVLAIYGGFKFVQQLLEQREERNRVKRAHEDARKEAAAYPDFYIDINAFMVLQGEMRTFGSAVQEMRDKLAALPKPLAERPSTFGGNNYSLISPECVEMQRKINQKKQEIWSLQLKIKTAADLLGDCIPTINGVADYLRKTAEGFSNAEKKAYNEIKAWQNSIK